MLGVFFALFRGLFFVVLVADLLQMLLRFSKPGHLLEVLGPERVRDPDCVVKMGSRLGRILENFVVYLAQIGAAYRFQLLVDIDRHGASLLVIVECHVHHIHVEFFGLFQGVLQVGLATFYFHVDLTQSKLLVDCFLLCLEAFVVLIALVVLLGLWYKVLGELLHALICLIISSPKLPRKVQVLQGFLFLAVRLFDLFKINFSVELLNA